VNGHVRTAEANVLLPLARNQRNLPGFCDEWSTGLAQEMSWKVRYRNIDPYWRNCSIISGRLVCESELASRDSDLALLIGVACLA